MKYSFRAVVRVFTNHHRFFRFVKTRTGASGMQSVFNQQKSARII